MIHDNDAIFSAKLDASLTRLGLKVITTPVRSPQANSLCERLIGTLRRECLDWIIPLSEGHLRKALASWMGHYNRGRPHSSLGPGVPNQHSAFPCLQRDRHRFDRPVSIEVLVNPLLAAQLSDAILAAQARDHDLVPPSPLHPSVYRFSISSSAPSAVKAEPKNLFLLNRFKLSNLC